MAAHSFQSRPTRLSYLMVVVGLVVGSPLLAQEAAQSASSTKRPATAASNEPTAQPKEQTSKASLTARLVADKHSTQPRLGAAGAMIFVDPETGELTSEPAPGQLERLFAQGRALARQSTASSITPNTTPTLRQPSLEELSTHTAPTFVTPVGIGTALDSRFLHGLHVSFAEDGEKIFSCALPSHRHSAGSSSSTTATSPTSASVPRPAGFTQSAGPGDAQLKNGPEAQDQ